MFNYNKQPKMTSKQELLEMLLRLQKLQFEDGMKHRFYVDTYCDEDGDFHVNARFISVKDFDEDGDGCHFTCFLSNYHPKRQNEAELEKFEQLLLSDK